MAKEPALAFNRFDTPPERTAFQHAFAVRIHPAPGFSRAKQRRVLPSDRCQEPTQRQRRRRLRRALDANSFRRHEKNVVGPAGTQLRNLSVSANFAHAHLESQGPD